MSTDWIAAAIVYLWAGAVMVEASKLAFKPPLRTVDKVALFMLAFGWAIVMPIYFIWQRQRGKQ